MGKLVPGVSATRLALLLASAAITLLHIAATPARANTPAPEPLPPPPRQRASAAAAAAAAIRHDDEPEAVVDKQLMDKIGLLLQGDMNVYREHEEAGLSHARAMEKMSLDERRKMELQFVREAAQVTIDRDHGGDIHSFFSSLDSTKDEHLSDAELLELMGADPVRAAIATLYRACSCDSSFCPRSTNGDHPVHLNRCFTSGVCTIQNNATHLGIYDKLRQQMVKGVKAQIDIDQDGKVHRDEFHRALHQGEL